MQDLTIARSARRLRLAVWAAMAMICAIYLLNHLAPQLGPLRIQSRLTGAGWASRALLDVTLALFVIALFRLTQMLSAITEGTLFGPRVTRAFRGFAFWLFLATLLDVLGGPALAIARAAREGAGQTELIFELRDLLMLVGALFLFLLARMLERARTIESELEVIV